METNKPLTLEEAKDVVVQKNANPNTIHKKVDWNMFKAGYDKSNVPEKYYDEAAELYKSSHVSALQKELESKNKTLDFYRDQTASVRKFVFDSKDIGLPNQNIFEAIIDKLSALQAEIEALRKERDELLQRIPNKPCTP